MGMRKSVSLILNTTAREKLNEHIRIETAKRLDPIRFERTSLASP